MDEELRNLLEELHSLLGAQIRERHINSIEELHNYVARIGNRLQPSEDGCPLCGKPVSECGEPCVNFYLRSGGV